MDRRRGHPFGMKKTQSQISSLLGSEQRFHPRTLPPKRVTPVWEILKCLFPQCMWYKTLACWAEALPEHTTAPARPPALSSTGHHSTGTVQADTHKATSQHAVRIQQNCPAKAILATPAEVVPQVLLSACTSERGRWRGHLSSRPGFDSPEFRVQGGDSTRHTALSLYFFYSPPDQIDISTSPINFIWVKIIFPILLVKGHKRTPFLCWPQLLKSSDQVLLSCTPPQDKNISIEDTNHSM